MKRSTSLPALAALAMLVAAGATAQQPAGPPAEPSAGPPAAADWPQWGGPSHDFRAPSRGLADRWPEGGPPRLWQRELGEGYSTILYRDGRLYTLYRAGEREVVACLDAADGHTLWEHAYESSPHPGHVDEHGRGPRATPLLAGDRLFTIGVAGRMHALDKNTGRVLWTRELWGEELGGNYLLHGYSSSPIAHRDTVIALVGGKGASIVAFRQDDGAIAWKAQGFENSYSSPQVVEIAGERQLVAFMAAEVVGVDPDNGELRWSFPVENQFAQNITMPTVVDGRWLFVSAYQVGARGLELTRNGGAGTHVEQVWSTLKIQYYHVSTVRDGDWVYGSTGLRAPAFLSAVNVRTGEIGWRARGFAKANLVWADGKLFILDEDGKLAVATATPEGLTVHSEAQVLERVALTPPTIVGTTMYLRDKSHVMALDLGAAAATGAPAGEAK